MFDRLYAGICVFHNGKPVILLHLLRSTPDCQIWRVRPAFVDDPVDRNETFRPHDTVTYPHTGRDTC